MAARVFLIAVYALIACNGLSKARFHSHHNSHQSRDASALRRNVEAAEVQAELPRPPPVHYGCFEGQNLQLLNNTIIDGNTNALCQKYCYDMKHMFSATHGDVCGCLKDHPQKELSGPKHNGATVTVRNSAHGCTDPCPGHNKDTCEKQFCCGGGGAYTVYQIGGMKSHSLAAIKVLKGYNVNIVKSHIIPPLDDISKRTQIPVGQLKGEIKKPADPNDFKALLEEMTQSKVTLGTNSDKGLKNKLSDADEFEACCSPDCDWLLNYLEIDRTVVVCCKGEGEDEVCEKPN